MTQEALKRVAEKLRRAGANLPAPEVTGTIEGSVVTGLCIALALVESEIEALAQPEQGPVAWMKANDTEWSISFFEWSGYVPLFTTPPQRTWVGLTYDEFKQIMLATYNIDLNVPGHSSDDYLLWNAIEAKLKEKNT